MIKEIIHIEEDSKDILSFIRYRNNQGKDNSASRDRMKRILNKAIANELTSRQRECLRLRYLDGMPVKNIAKEMELSNSTVSRHISAAMRKLKKVASYYE